MNLLLHPGIHKTGTTSIQRVLFDHRRWLAQRGLVYPVAPPFSGPRAHHKLAHDLAQGGPDARKAARSFLETAALKARPGDTLIISSEPICRHHAGGNDWAGLVAHDYIEQRRVYLEVLSDVLAGFEVEVILYLRDYGYWLAWLHRVLQREKAWAGDAAAFKENFGERFAYKRQISLLAEYFPRIRTFSYEEAKVSGLIEHFFQQIGYPVPPGSAGVWERPTRKPIRPL